MVMPITRVKLNEQYFVELWNMDILLPWGRYALYRSTPQAFVYKGSSFLLL